MRKFIYLFFIYLFSSVACRNALLDLLLNLKLCDFGLSRQMHTGKDGHEYYAMSKNAPLPVRWYAIPLLLQRTGLYCLTLFFLRVCCVGIQDVPRIVEQHSI